MSDVRALADEIETACRTHQLIAPFSGRAIDFDLPTAYAVEGELAQRRIAAGRRVVGRKVGFANKAMWRILKLQTLVWAHMYDDTVLHATANETSLSIDGRVSPRLEPEIVFKVARPLGAGTADAKEALDHVEWIALGFEINDSLYPEWKFQPADFVAAYGLHTALVVGKPRLVTPDRRDALLEQLPTFTLQLLKSGEVVEKGSGKESLRSPALCLGELARVVPLEAGEIISTGTLTAAQPIAHGDTWTARVDGIDLPELTLHVQ